MPKSGGEQDHVAQATTRVPGAYHYWDGQGSLMRQYDALLALGEDAWDIYLIYGPDARWEGSHPPVPAYWMHQLGEPEAPRVTGPYLDAAVLAGKARALIPGQR